MKMRLINKNDLQARPVNQYLVRNDITLNDDICTYEIVKYIEKNVCVTLCYWIKNNNILSLKFTNHFMEQDINQIDLIFLIKKTLPLVNILFIKSDIQL